MRELTRRHGVLLAFDEMITGFRWHLAGSQAFYGVTPDMATFGKAIGNGFSVSALVGRRDVLELGGIDHAGPGRVFLLSATHGGEVTLWSPPARRSRSCASATAPTRVWEVGRAAPGRPGKRDRRSRAGRRRALRRLSVQPGPRVPAEDAPASAAALRTLFLQETVVAGVLIPYIAPSLSHDARGHRADRAGSA